jgi:lantibiotic modifying enzyme
MKDTALKATDIINISEDINSRIVKILSEISLILSSEKTTYDKTGLYEGELGAAVFQAHLYLWSKKEEILDRMYCNLSRSIDKINLSPQSFTFADGFAGVMWSLSHLRNLKLISTEDLEVVDGEIEDFLKRSLYIDIRDGNYDLLYGYLGKISALIEKGSTSQVLEDIYLDLEKRAIWEGTGCYLIDSDYEEQKIVNLGLAHGLPGIVMFLLKVSSLGREKKIDRLIDGFANWISSSANQSLYSRFSTGKKPGDILESPSRLAWCYGDLGMALMFLSLQKQNPDQKWGSELHLTLEALKNRNLNNSGIAKDKETGLLDIGFCHGTSGICYQFKKIFLQTGDLVIGQKMQYWLDQTITGVESYLETHFIKANNGSNKPDPGLLNGLSGAGLVLLSFLEVDQHDWEKIFLLA